MRNRRRQSRLWFAFTLIIFFTVIIIFFILLIVWAILYRAGVLSFAPVLRSINVLALLFASIIIGACVAFFVGRVIVRPIQEMGDAFERLAEGDFSVRIPTDRGLAEIREMAERFNSMASDLSQIDTLSTDFMANVSHEFKTPIAAIEGYATLLQDENLDAEKRRLYVEKIMSNSRRLSDLSSNILTLTKLENEENDMNRTEYRLDEQIRKNILLLENKWTEKNIEFDFDAPNLVFLGNEALLDQVWFNLLDNAIKHSPENNVIQITMTPSETSVSVSIADHGEGMNEEVKKHIFEKFYQGDQSRMTEGSGLGLALVQRIVHMCHGKIKVDSAPGRGAVFTVILPV